MRESERLADGGSKGQRVAETEGWWEEIYYNVLNRYRPEIDQGELTPSLTCT